MQISVKLCILSILTKFTVSFYFPSCPERCLCTSDFTDCKFNHLTALPKNLDANITSLDLSYNDFEEFPHNLSHFTSLIYLNLSHNLISVLDGNSALDSLRNLEILDLTFNLFRDWNDIKSRAFYNIRKLKSLDFSNNPVRSIPEYSNPLKIGSLQILRLNNCSMKNLYSNVFHYLPNLIELHVSNNPITSINGTFSSDTLKFFDLSNCNLKHISDYAFSNLINLETIWLFGNSNLKRFSCSSLSLLYLDLSNCNLETVPNGYLPKVYYTNFHGNHFRIIPKYSFRNFTELKFLDLSYNAISSIGDNAFQGLDNVEIIDLSFNTLSNLNRDIFYSNIKLKILNLSRNYFNRIEHFNIQSLEILDLSRCEIQKIERDCLKNMPNLMTLNLSTNSISSIPDFFQGPNLKILDVSYCRIKNMNNKTLVNLVSLRQINLAGNRLTTITPDCCSQIIMLEISDNPWRCDCKNLHDMYFWLLRTGKRVDTLICQSPDIYEGDTWQRACQIEWYPELYKKEPVWWYTTGLIIIILLILLIIVIMKTMYKLKAKRLREANEARRAEEREALRRMQRIQREARDDINRNAPDPRESQRPPSYNEALLLPRLDASHPSLSGSLHSIASKHSLHGSNPDVSRKGRPRRKRRRRKSDSSEGQRASRTTADSDTTDQDTPQPRTTLESDF